MKFSAELLISLILLAVLGYALGSINSSILFTKLFKNREDIRSHGSGNAGMTNVLRTVGKLAAVLTFIGDFIKCIASVLSAYFVMQYVCSAWELSSDWIKFGQCVAGVFCVIGHVYPVYFGFRGGKGVVTSAAMISLLDWRVFILVLATFIIVMLLKRIVSLSSICCAVGYPIYTFAVTYIFDYAQGPMGGDRSLFYLCFTTVFALFIGILVLFKHRSNIERLRKGEEKPVSLKKKA